MKELGEYLKEQREENSVGLEEASEDLNISKDELENIEEGNIRAFKDVLGLKVKIKMYAKYLGLEPEKVLDEFNDFMFEHTSKISLSDIMEASKHKESIQQKQIRSPYTKIKEKKINIKRVLIFIGSCILFILLLILVFNLVKPKDSVINQELSSGGVNYEFTY